MLDLPVTRHTSANANSGRERSLWPWIVATVIALPVLYVATIGPVIRLGIQGAISRKASDGYCSAFDYVNLRAPNWFQAATYSHFCLWLPDPPAGADDIDWSTR